MTTERKLRGGQRIALVRRELHALRDAGLAVAPKTPNDMSIRPMKWGRWREFWSFWRPYEKRWSAMVDASQPFPRMTREIFVVSRAIWEHWGVAPDSVAVDRAEPKLYATSRERAAQITGLRRRSLG